MALVPFSEQEAVVLLDAYLKSLSGELTRQEAIKECSELLRRMAINSGNEIDDIFRNTNGIYFQMRSMESAFQGQILHNKPPTRLFLKVVELYRSSPEQYHMLLEEAFIKGGKASHELPEDFHLEDQIVDNSNDTMINYLNRNDLHYVDERAEGGALWIIGGLEIYSKLTPLRNAGVRFQLLTDGIKNPTGRPAWWTKDKAVISEI